MSLREPRRFWREAFALQGSVTPLVIPHVAAFGAISALVWLGSWCCEEKWGLRWGLEVAPLEFAGAALGLLLILRTNAGYDRWWEARKLWGGIVNQSRNAAISGITFGPTDPAWRVAFVNWLAVFPHIARSSLRGDSPPPEVANLVGDAEAKRIALSSHMPSYVAHRIALLLRDARENNALDGFSFVQIDKERAALIDHIGACERILKTPLPKIYSIKIRRFITLFLLTLPFALLHRLQGDWNVPFVTMLVAYPLISLDQIGVELQNPFAEDHLGHLPLDEISSNIERNVLGVLNYDSLPPAKSWSELQSLAR